MPNHPYRRNPEPFSLTHKEIRYFQATVKRRIQVLTMVTSLPGSSPPHHEVTALLIEWRQGDAGALERLVPLVYAELKKVAGAHLQHEQAGHSLQATALVHEVYLRLVNVDRMTCTSHPARE
jgi:hypothetical protein